jgi:hypothetical protein
VCGARLFARARALQQPTTSLVAPDGSVSHPPPIHTVHPPTPVPPGPLAGASDHPLPMQCQPAHGERSTLHQAVTHMPLHTPSGTDRLLMAWASTACLRRCSRMIALSSRVAASVAWLWTVHASSSRLELTPRAHASSSRLLELTPRAHTSSSRLELTPRAHAHQQPPMWSDSPLASTWCDPARNFVSSHSGFALASRFPHYGFTHDTIETLNG